MPRAISISKISFSDDVTVLCVNPWRRNCAISHCGHGQIQETLAHLQFKITVDDAPLSASWGMAVSSSNSWNPDESSFMQLQPRRHNEPEVPPWYGYEPQHFAAAHQEDDPTDDSDFSEESPGNEDPNGPDDDPPADDPDDPAPGQPPSEDDERQSALLFHLTDVPVHAMLHWVHFEPMMREIAHHFAIDRAELLDCHDMQEFPDDTPVGTVPIIVQFARDIPVGQQMVLILIDIALHGQEREPHFQTAPRVQRKVVPVPYMLARQTLLIQLQVFEYCRFEHNRCLVNHNKDAWPFQEFWPRQMQHGDYVEIIIPPPQKCDESTAAMLNDSRRLEVEDFWDRYYIPTSPSEALNESETDVSPSLIDSEEIRNEYGPRNDEDAPELEDDAASLMHIQTASSSSTGPNTEQAVNDSCVLNFPMNFDPAHDRWPLWFRGATSAFFQGATIEDDDEGPVAFLTTWYADCNLPLVSEESRVIRVDSYSYLWAQDIQNLWQDKIQTGVPVHFAWVQPRPPETPYARTIGHLIVFQHPNQLVAPVLLHFDFQALNLDGTAFAVAVLRHSATPEEVVTQAKLDRICRGRRCTLHRGVSGFKWTDDLLTGECIKLFIPPPGGRAHDQLHWGLGSVALVFPDDFVPAVPLLSMRIEDQPTCIQSLYELWLQLARRGGAEIEMTLVIQTWYLDGVSVTRNDEHRPVLLGDDYTTWIDDMRRVWQDQEDASLDMDFALIHPTPPCSPLSSIHVLLYQQFASNQVGVVVSIYDNAVVADSPHSIAVVLPNLLMTNARLLEAVGRQSDCELPGVQCRSWYEGCEITPEGRSVKHGDSLQIHIYRAHLHDWDQDDGIALMQTNGPHHAGRTQGTSMNAVLANTSQTCLNVHAAEFIPGRPMISSLPEQLQDLHALWHQHASVSERGERRSSVQTWFLSPGTQRMKCGYSRKVHLYEDYMQWEQRIKEVWHDDLDPTSPVFLFVVQPTPIALEHDAVAHVLVTQAPTENEVSSLVTIFDNAVHNGHPFRIAIVTHEHIRQAEILERIGYTEEVRRYATSMRCVFWHNSYQFHHTQRVPGRDGDNLMVRFDRNLIEPDWHPPFLPVNPGMEGLQFLQMQTTQLGKTIRHEAEESETVKLNISPVQSVLDSFDTHFSLPAFDIESRLEGHVHWLPESLQWIRTFWYACDGPVDRIRIYYDGSFKPSAQTIGFAAAAFVHYQGDWCFAGAISGMDHTNTGLGSYKAELFASTIATKFLYDISKVLCELFACQPRCELVFDSLTVGRQSEGRWKAAKAIEGCHLIRSILRLCESRFGIIAEHTFCPSHAGEPGNELVDQLAFSAASGFPLQDWTHFLDQMQRREVITAMEWTWMLFEPLPAVHATEGQLHFPAKPSTTPANDVIPTFEAPQGLPQQWKIKMTVATCNILTLQSGRKTDQIFQTGVAGPSRQEWILNTFAEHGVHIFALQETRLKKIWKHQDPHFHLIQSSATAQGHFGMMIGLAKHSPHGWHGTTPVHFTEDHFTIIVAEPRILIIAVRSEALKCLVIAAHAPHTGAPFPDIDKFWRDVTFSIPVKYDSWPKLLLTDANCRIGGQPNGRVGDWQSEGMNEKSQPFVDFLAVQDLFLPSTFEDLHHGSGGTWLHFDGTWKRNDFIGLSCSLPYQECTTWIPEEIDFSLAKEDHRPLFARIAWEVTCMNGSHPKRGPKYRHEHFDQKTLADQAKKSKQSFDVDVHTHAWQVQQALVACCRRKVSMPKKPRKATITAMTWTLIQHKQQWRRVLADHQKIQKQTQLTKFFAAWRCSRYGKLPEIQIQEFDRMLQAQDRDIASALSAFRDLGRQVTAALRSDDAAFFACLSREVSDFLGPHQTREFWQILRRSLPRFRSRRFGHDPHKVEVLQDQWAPYFMQLESGVQKAAPRIVEDCHSRQMGLPPAQLCFDHSDLPSIIELEDALRETQADKATGLDPIPSGLFRAYATELATIYFPLLFKICIWQHEPVASKGGQIAVIYKRGSGLQASDYRGIMLLPSFAKRLHALLRVRVMKLLGHQRPQGQLGGFPAMQVPYGSQLLQTFGRLMDAIDVSSAVVFIDLSNAFHRLIRELVSGISIPEDVEDLLERLMEEGLPVTELIEVLQLPCLLEKLQAPQFLVKLIQDLHTDTWMYVPGAQVPIVTKKGTRPGSPLADCIFHVLMTDIAKDLNALIADDRQFQKIMQKADLHVESIIWADDVAIPVATETASDLPQAIEHILVSAHAIFMKRGFTLNMQKGKTSVVATFRGPGAPIMRAKFQLCARPGIEVCFNGQMTFVHFVGHYKHLGTIFSSSHTMDQEIATRIGLAKSAFAQVAATILCNRNIPEHTRVRMFRALIESRLFFGLGGLENTNSTPNGKDPSSSLSHAT